MAPIDSMKDTMMLDVKLKLLKSINRYIENRTRLRLYSSYQGSTLSCEVLLDKNNLVRRSKPPQLEGLEEEVVAKKGDKFVVRFTLQCLLLAVERS